MLLCGGWEHFANETSGPREAGEFEGLCAVAQGGNHKQRLRCLALGLLVNVALHGGVDAQTLKGWHEQLPCAVADERSSKSYYLSFLHSLASERESFARELVLLPD